MNKRLPACGSFIKYISKVNGQGSAEFVFKTANVERFLFKKGIEGNSYGSDTPGSLYYWVKRHRKGLNEVSTIPSEIEVYDSLIEGMAKELPFVVKCLECGEQRSSHELSREPESEKRMNGWLSDDLLCPNGHPLLKIKVMHIMAKRRRTDLEYLDLPDFLQNKATADPVVLKPEDEEK
jgi:hypothetical protein